MHLRNHLRDAFGNVEALGKLLLTNKPTFMSRSSLDEVAIDAGKICLSTFPIAIRP
jgi:hypothetical protein